MWKGLVHIRESEVYLNMGELLYNIIAVYIITVLITTSAELESHNNLLVVSCYLDHFFSASFKFHAFEAVGPMLIILLVHIYIGPSCSKTWSVHCCLRYAIIINIILSCSYM